MVASSDLLGCGNGLESGVPSYRYVLSNGFSRSSSIPKTQDHVSKMIISKHDFEVVLGDVPTLKIMEPFIVHNITQHIFMAKPVFSSNAVIHRAPASTSKAQVDQQPMLRPAVKSSSYHQQRRRLQWPTTSATPLGPQYTLAAHPAEPPICYQVRGCAQPLTFQFQTTAPTTAPSVADKQKAITEWVFGVLLCLCFYYYIMTLCFRINRNIESQRSQQAQSLRVQQPQLSTSPASATAAPVSTV